HLTPGGPVLARGRATRFNPCSPVQTRRIIVSTKFEVKGDTSLDDWIDGVSYLQADVTIYRNPALLAEYRPLLARIDDLEGERAALVEDAPESDPEASLASKKAKTNHPR